MKIILVDDSQLMLDRLSEMISELSDVEIVGRFSECEGVLAAINESKPDSIILDIKLPDGNGIDLLAHIKEMDQSPVVVMFTDYPYPQYRQKSLELGADYFFEKSKDFEMLSRTLFKLQSNKPRNGSAV